MNDKVIKDFVNKHLTQQYCKLDSYMYSLLLDFQSNYTTAEEIYYPFESAPGFNFYEYINNIESNLETTQHVYQFNIAEDVKGDEYYNRLYFRRRQGWGKSIITQLPLIN